MKALLVVFAMMAVACSSGTSENPVSVPSASTVLGNDQNLVCWSATRSGTPGEARFREATEELGLVEPLTGIYGHAAAWGDINDDGFPDLVAGTFADRPVEAYQFRGAEGPKPDRLLVSTPGLVVDEEWSEELDRTSGALFADLDGDGDDDLVLVRNARGETSGRTVVFENRDGSLVEAAEFNLGTFKGRTPTVADFDGDGLLDLYISEDRYGDTGGILFANHGGFSFINVTAGSGLEGVASLGARAVDLNEDRRPDLVLSTGIFVNVGDGRFLDVTPPGYVTESVGAEDDPAGVAVGDLNDDGRPDVVVGQHFRSTLEFEAKIPIRIFLNEFDGESVAFTDITEASGIPPFSTLAPHVHIADIDNDSRPDIVTSASANGGQTPALFINQGGDVPRFLAVAGEGSAQYWVGAPLADINHDGRLDMFAVEWEPSLPSLMFLNESSTGHWLEVSVDGPGRGIGTVAIVETEAGELIGRQEIGAGTGYSSGHQPIAHFGLGSHQEVVLSLQSIDGELAELGLVQVDAHLRWPSGCG